LGGGGDAGWTDADGDEGVGGVVGAAEAVDFDFVVDEDFGFEEDEEDAIVGGVGGWWICGGVWVDIFTGVENEGLAVGDGDERAIILILVNPIASLEADVSAVAGDSGGDVEGRGVGV
jgi:hypothetical protein